MGEGEMGKGDQVYGDRWKLKFWWYGVINTEIGI